MEVMECVYGPQRVLITVSLRYKALTREHVDFSLWAHQPGFRWQVTLQGTASRAQAGLVPCSCWGELGVCAPIAQSNKSCWAPQIKQASVRFFTDFRTIFPHAYSSWRVFLYLKLFFLFVLGGCVAWIFVFNSSLRIKRRKNPTLLSAYAASPEVWDINTVCFLYGFPKGTENVMIFNWLFHVFSALVK